MARKFDEGFESVGHIEGLSEELSAAYLKLDARGAVLSLPSIGSMGDLFRNFVDKDEDDVPASLRFHGTAGTYVLEDCRGAGGSVSSLGTSLTRVRSPRLVEAGSGAVGYAAVDGMTSEIDGLASWTELSTVTQTLERDPVAVVLRAENKPEIPLGGSLNATVESSFSFNPSPKGNVFGITDVALLRTRSDDLLSYREHAAVHHMVQDLMCLVYGRPCFSRVASVKREDDQPYAAPDDPRRTWREVYEPSFGRSVDGAEPLDRGKAHPLFRLAEVDAAKLTDWIDHWDLWSRPTWIAVTTMFQRGTTVESKLLQIGVALEALGYALWQESGPTSSAPTPKYPELLERVAAAAGVEHIKIHGERTVDQWRMDFNAAFKGSKHADNPLPDGLVAHHLAQQGMNLIRAWLATRLGVPTATIKKGFDRA